MESIASKFVHELHQNVSAYDEAVTRFGDALAEEYAPNLSEAVQKRVFETVWKGGTEPASEVEEEYELLAEFTNFVWDAAQQK